MRRFMLPILAFLLLLCMSAVPGNAQRLTLSGIYGVPSGGTGAASLTANALLLGNGTSAIQAIACTGTTSIWQGGSPGSCTATPTIGTSLTTPVVIGGTAAGSTLTLRSTSGVGTTDAIIFQVGNNGATEAARFTTGGQMGLGTNAPDLAGHGAAARILSLRATGTSYSVAELWNVGAVGDGVRMGEVNYGDNAQRVTLSGWRQGTSGGRIATVTATDAGTMTFATHITNTQSFVMAASEVIGTSAARVFAHGAGTCPTTYPADIAQWCVTDISGAGTAGPRVYTEDSTTWEVGGGIMVVTSTGGPSVRLTRAGDAGLANITNDGAGLYISTSGEANPIIFRVNDVEGFRLRAVGVVQWAGGTEPSCDSTTRGSLVLVVGALGVADTFRVCTKDAADAYGYRALF